jgi:ATP-dependent RNA helicase SUPV3L1/SUV3
VALYQAGEVDHLIATDAIGMGLNLDVHHVAFAGLRKFDGRQARDLELGELGQIAGRAGRFTRDGTFAAVSPLQMPVSWARAVEQHAFPSVRRAYWRNADLDFSSVETLKAALSEKPKSPALLLARDAEDAAALDRLVTFDDVRQRARGAERVRLLWDVASVPDFRKLLFESHVAFLREVYMELSGPRGVLQSDWIGPRIAELDDTSGESEALIGRIAAVRTWTYVSHQHGWVQHADEWQARTRRLEDDLSDALHEALMRRFVDHSQKRRRRPTQKPSSSRATGGPEGLREQLERLVVGNADGKADRPAGESAGESADPSAPLTIDEGFVVRRGERIMGRLTGGKRLTQPHCQPHHLTLGQLPSDPQDVAAGVRNWIRERFSFASDEIEGASGARGILYALEEGLGSALREEVAAALAVCSAEDRALLDARGVVVGKLYVYSRVHLKPRRVTDRKLLACVHLGAPLPAVPPSPHSVAFDPGIVAGSVGRELAHPMCAAMGYPVWGPRAVRVDLVERIAAATELSAAVAARWLQTSPEIAEGVIGAIRAALETPGERTNAL